MLASLFGMSDYLGMDVILGYTNNHEIIDDDDDDDDARFYVSKQLLLIYLVVLEICSHSLLVGPGCLYMCVWWAVPPTMKI